MRHVFRRKTQGLMPTGPVWLPPRFAGLLLLPLLLVVGLSTWVEREQYRMAAMEIGQEASLAASAYAGQIANRLMTHFTELEFVAVSLLAAGGDPAAPNATTVKALRSFMAIRPGLYAFNVQSPDGNTIVWSTKHQSSTPISPGYHFTPLPSNANLLLGQDVMAARVGFRILTMRYRLRDAQGRTRYFVGTPFRLDHLLRDDQPLLPWMFEVVDTRDGSILGVWQKGHVDFEHKTHPLQGKMLAVPGYPFQVRVSWPSSLVSQEYLQTAPLRWMLEIGVLSLLIAALYMLFTLLRQRARDAMRLQRLSDFNALLAQVNQVIADSEQSDELFQAICDLAIHFGHLKLAWVGRPDASGRFQFMAASGELAYLDDLFISVDPTIPEGRGAVGQAWRDGRAYYNQSFDEDVHLKPWVVRAHQLGFEASAALPILRGGQVVAILAVFHAQAHIWDADLKALLGELPQDIARGLDQIETKQLQRALQDNSVVGITLMRECTIQNCNARFAQMLGYSVDELRGQSIQHLYSDEDEKHRVNRAFVQLPELRMAQLQAVHFVHKDGSPVLCDISGVLLQGQHAALSVWTLQNVTLREQQSLRLQRLSDFNALLAQVNQVIADSEQEAALLQAICDLAIRYGHLQLAWVGRPDGDQRFQFIASSGQVAYLEGLFVSADPNVPAGQGSSGRAWREARAYYNQSYSARRMLGPWQERARQLGFQASAALPIMRNGETWGQLNVYHAQSHIWDDDLKALLEELAQAVSRGLDRVDALHRKRELERDLDQVRAYQRTLFEKNAAGIFLIDQQRLIVDVNSSLSTMTGYATEELIGQSMRLLYGDSVPFRDFADQFEVELRAEASIQLVLQLRRMNGVPMMVQALGSAVTLPQGERGVLWSVIDITALQQAQAQLQRQAFHDLLTDLPNRRALEEHLPRTIARAHLNQGVVAVGMLDLDNFKPVNDAWGHEAGDRLLQELASRLRAHLRDGDLLARLGGDEFVIVIEDLDTQQATAQLAELLERLHQAVETPFEVAPGAQAMVGMSLGVALFPFDGMDGDTLIRQADAAMYQAKQYKHDRVHWWQPGMATVEHAETEQVFDVYGEEAVALLNKSQPYLQLVTQKFIELFYTELSQEPRMHAILRNFTEAQISDLMALQAGYIEFLLTPSTTQAMILGRARQVGQVHALVGVTAGLLTQSLSLYRRLLNEQLKEFLLPARTRYHLLLTAEARLQEDLQIQLDIEGQVLNAYFDHLSRPLPTFGAPWTDASAAEATWLGELPGIQGVMLMRLNPEGVFTVENSAGPLAAKIAEVLRDPATQAVVDPSSPLGQGLSAQAWRSLQILSSPAYALDPRYRAWHAVVESWGLRSSLSIPVVNPAGQAEAVISLFGAYPNQFESNTLQHFARGLQQRWEQIWVRCSTQAPVISEDQAALLRETLFSGGLRMYMQPVVDLFTGRLVKVEALARLLMPDGQVIPPGVFLPLLGQAELDHLFRLGLDESLARLTQWDAQGLVIDMAVNLPPSNLLDANCPNWVAQNLRQHGMAPERLTLELLESQNMDMTQHDDTIDQFLHLGVRLAMDDLGAGYSSLLRLSMIPFHTIKIDQGLLVHIRDNPVQTISLIASILQMGRDFDRVVVAEGLEDPGMIEAVALLGAHFGQGYGIARPMPAEDIFAWHAQFTPPFARTAIRTFLGALAYHWRVLHQEHLKHAPVEGDCPLTRFLAACGRDDPEAAHWHQQMQVPGMRAEWAAALLTWLAERVRAERVAENDGQ